MNLEAAENGDTITVKKEGLEQSLFLLSQSSLAINACPGWILSSYCLGTACDVKGLQFTLQRKSK